MVLTRNDFSKYSLWLCFLVVAVFILTAKDWRQDNKVIAADVVSYYAYLPATFIFHDIKLEKQGTFDNGKFWPEPLPDGNRVIKTSMGMSLLYAPFFLLAHLIAIIFSMDAYGFSPIYKIGLLLSAFSYFCIGLIFLRKLLRRYFSDQIVALTLLVVLLGTNLLYYATSEATMTHVFNFALVNVFIWFTIKWYETPKFSMLMWLGLLAGLITLVRPSNIVVLIFFFLYGVHSLKSLQNRLKFIFQKIHWFIAMGVAFTIVWVPQMAYWWSITGKLFVNSYPDEQFFWSNPHFIDALFSYRKGWLVYTPVMFLALVGIPMLFYQLKEFSWAILVFIALASYIIVSWWCWWYGGSFGMRSFVDYYGMLAIPLAVLFTQITKLRKHSFLVVVSIAVLAVSQNIFFMEKYKRNSIHWDSTTKASFWHSFWHIKPQPGYWELLSRPDYEEALEGNEAVE